VNNSLTLLLRVPILAWDIIGHMLEIWTWKMVKNAWSNALNCRSLRIES